MNAALYSFHSLFSPDKLANEQKQINERNFLVGGYEEGIKRKVRQQKEWHKGLYQGRALQDPLACGARASYSTTDNNCTILQSNVEVAETSTFQNAKYRFRNRQNITLLPVLTDKEYMDETLIPPSPEDFPECQGPAVPGNNCGGFSLIEIIESIKFNFFPSEI